ncbi:protein of unknown function (plasmid) [Shinella sp. WSC3-e]|nr:protein of unknown function [Shinella sp. WSC3-e]
MPGGVLSQARCQILGAGMPGGGLEASAGQQAADAEKTVRKVAAVAASALSRKAFPALKRGAVLVLRMSLSQNRAACSGEGRSAGLSRAIVFDALSGAKRCRLGRECSRDRDGPAPHGTCFFTGRG